MNSLCFGAYNLPLFLQATANLVPLNSRRVLVKFDFFKIASLVGDNYFSYVVYLPYIKKNNLRKNNKVLETKRQFLIHLKGIKNSKHSRRCLELLVIPENVYV